jgi:hypothetical protein
MEKVCLQAEAARGRQNNRRIICFFGGIQMRKGSDCVT